MWQQDRIALRATFLQAAQLNLLPARPKSQNCLTRFSFQPFSTDVCGGVADGVNDHVPRQLTGGVLPDFDEFDNE